MNRVEGVTQGVTTKFGTVLEAHIEPPESPELAHAPKLRKANVVLWSTAARCPGFLGVSVFLYLFFFTGWHGSNDDGVHDAHPWLVLAVGG